MPGTILIVDDDAAVRESLARVLHASGGEVRVAASGEGALREVAAASPDLVLSDVRMPGMDGLALLRLLRERAPSLPVILMSGYGDLPTAAAAMRDGAADFLAKPVEASQLLAVIGRVMRQGSRAAPARVPEEPDDHDHPVLVGNDPRMIEVFKVVGQVARTRANVLIRGETGVGKELVARTIHAGSRDAGQPFVAVNCAAVPGSLLESELFGHVKGAFTGADRERRGRFAAAGRGTLFLDEIGDMPADLQPKLLRVLQERCFQPVGSDHDVPLHARVVTATHRDLEALVAAGDFREDLYYRLRVVEITIPPLRERRGDILDIARQLLARACRTVGLDGKWLSPAAEQALLDYDWPGNVRELENCLMRAVVVATGSVVGPEHLILGTAPPRPPTELLSLAAVERDHVVRVLQATGGHKRRTAEILGISRPRLDRLIRKHGIRVPGRRPPAPAAPALCAR